MFCTIHHVAHGQVSTSIQMLTSYYHDEVIDVLSYRELASNGVYSHYLIC